MAIHTDLAFPPDFLEQMQRLLPGEFEEFMESMNDKSPVSIRLNQLKKNNNEVREKVLWCNSGRYLSERPVFTLDPHLHGGAYYVQEASSMFLEQAVIQSLDLSKGIKMLDLCAAPGGKSTHLLSLINDESLLVSNEVIKSRASILEENIQKWGRSNVIVTNNDPEDFQRLDGFFDVIVVDAPCSGEGLFRKDPEAMKEWSPENVDLCSKRQRRILNDIWPALKQGGLLIYSTCTYNSVENEENLRWASEQLDAEFLKLKLESSWGITEVAEKNIYGYHCFPHRIKGEGFFISVIRKTGEQRTVNQKIKNKIFQQPAAKITSQLQSWVRQAETKKFLQWKEQVLMVPASLANTIEFIVQHLHIISCGTAVCEIKQNKLIPDHALALSVDVNKDSFSQLKVIREQALQFLRKENMQVELPQRGFALVTYEDLPIGWANVLDNRINNLYPSNWRIRMAG